MCQNRLQSHSHTQAKHNTKNIMVRFSAWASMPPLQEPAGRVLGQGVDSVEGRSKTCRYLEQATNRPLGHTYIKYQSRKYLAPFRFSHVRIRRVEFCAHRFPLCYDYIGYSNHGRCALPAHQALAQPPPRSRSVTAASAPHAAVTHAHRERPERSLPCGPQRRVGASARRQSAAFSVSRTV